MNAVTVDLSHVEKRPVCVKCIAIWTAAPLFWCVVFWLVLR